MSRKDGSGVEEKLVPTVAAAAVVLGLGKALFDRSREQPAAQPPDRRPRPDHPDGEPQSGGDEFEPKSGGEEHSGDERGKRPKFLQRVGDRVPLLRKPLGVQQRFGELHGNNLAAAVTLQSFLALFPLLLVAVAVVGFFSAHSSADIPNRLARELGLSGDAANMLRDAVATARRSRRVASVVGLAGLFWSGLGLVSALQYAFNQVWQVEDRGVKDKAWGVIWLAGAALLFVGSSFLIAGLRWLPTAVSPVSVVVTVAVTFGLWLWTAKLLPNRDVGWKALVPGAILGTVGLELLKVIGAYYVPRLVAHSSELYGSIGVVFAILAWLLLFSRLIVYSAVVNVVLYEGKAGTRKAVVEVPPAAQSKSDVTPDVSRSGRVEKEATPA